MPNGIQQYTKLENRLVLLAWLNSLLGYESNRKLLEDTKTVGEGFGADGTSYLYHHLIARGSQVKIPKDDLARYDENIRQHLEKINRGRTERITLRYFQYLAALYTEIFLDRLFNHRAEAGGCPPLLADLNAFVEERNARRLPGEPQDAKFTEKDLTKLAYWMATGSGKTLLLHLNYHQFRHYNTEPLDNILLITPNISRLLKKCLFQGKLILMIYICLPGVDWNPILCFFLTPNVNISCLSKGFLTLRNIYQYQILTV
jgi:hypothetical protein